MVPTAILSAESATDMPNPPDSVGAGLGSVQMYLVAVGPDRGYGLGLQVNHSGSARDSPTRIPKLP